MSVNASRAHRLRPMAVGEVVFEVSRGMRAILPHHPSALASERIRNRAGNLLITTGT